MLIKNNVETLIWISHERKSLYFTFISQSFTRVLRFINKLYNKVFLIRFSFLYTQRAKSIVIKFIIIKFF